MKKLLARTPLLRMAHLTRIGWRSVARPVTMGVRALIRTGNMLQPPHFWSLLPVQHFQHMHHTAAPRLAAEFAQIVIGFERGAHDGTTGD